jgi:hypothetical protein
MIWLHQPEIDMIEIKHCYTNAVLFCGDLASVKDAVLKAKEDGANLCGADLCGAVINGEKIKKNPVTLGGFPWFVLITDGFMRIGCQRHSHTEWANLGEDIIEDAGGKKAVELWAIYKSILLALCAEQAK